MSLKELQIKAGSIMLTRKYNWFKRVWSEKIIRKELPYNNFIVFAGDTGIISKDSFSGVIVEPVKKYSNKESLMMCTIMDNSESIDNRDLFTVINAIRPNTFEEKEEDIAKLLNSKYYKIRKLSNETEYNEYIY